MRPNTSFVIPSWWGYEESYGSLLVRYNLQSPRHIDATLDIDSNYQHVWYIETKSNRVYEFRDVIRNWPNAIRNCRSKLHLGNHRMDCKRNHGHCLGSSIPTLDMSKNLPRLSITWYESFVLTTDIGYALVTDIVIVSMFESIALESEMIPRMMMMMTTTTTTVRRRPTIVSHRPDNPEVGRLKIRP